MSPLALEMKIRRCSAYRVTKLVWRDVLQRYWEVNEVQIDVTQSPCFVLRFCLSKCVILLVIVVPELRNDEDLFTLHEAFFDGSLDALACFMLVLVIICSVEQAVAGFYRL